MAVCGCVAGNGCLLRADACASEESTCVVGELARFFDRALQCSFTEPSIALQAGYVSVVSTTGKGPVLLLLPETGPGTSMTHSSGKFWRT